MYSTCKVDIVKMEVEYYMCTYPIRHSGKDIEVFNQGIWSVVKDEIAKAYYIQADRLIDKELLGEN